MTKAACTIFIFLYCHGKRRHLSCHNIIIQSPILTGLLQIVGIKKPKYKNRNNRYKRILEIFTTCRKCQNSRKKSHCPRFYLCRFIIHLCYRILNKLQMLSSIFIHQFHAFLCRKYFQSSPNPMEPTIIIYYFTYSKIFRNRSRLYSYHF